MTEIEYIKKLADSEKLDDKLRTYLKNWVFRPKELGFVFIMSFSKQRDFLPLWATFTKMEGFSLGFDNTELLKFVGHAIYQDNDKYKQKDIKLNAGEIAVEMSTSHSLLNTVIYDQDIQIEILNDILKDAIYELEKIYKDKNPVLLNTIINTFIALCSVFLKLRLLNMKKNIDSLNLS